MRFDHQGDTRHQHSHELIVRTTNESEIRRPDASDCAQAEKSAACGHKIRHKLKDQGSRDDAKSRTDIDSEEAHSAQGRKGTGRTRTRKEMPDAAREPCEAKSLNARERSLFVRRRGRNLAG